jgi:hypothetical protein
MPPSSSSRVRVFAGKLLLDYRVGFEVALLAAVLAAFGLSSRAANFDATLDKAMRADLYGALAATAGTLLGFVLAALAVLVALPTTERIVKLQEHPSWPLIPSTYFRASRALLAALLLCLLGLPLDSGTKPWLLYELLTLAALTLSLIRVLAAAVALDQILGVAGADKSSAGRASSRRIDDPGP